MSETFWKIFLFILGSTVGSFLNVVIYRVPRNISIVYPPSHCPHCGNPIKWYDNIPLLSYLVLRGRCRYCKERISFRYFVVELITALLFLFLYSKYRFTFYFFTYLTLSLALIIAGFIDWEHYLIPDIFSLSLIPLGFILSYFFPLHGFSHFKGLYLSLLGGITGFISLFLIGILGKILFRKESMGGGDMKLLAGIGCFLGIRGVLLTIFISSLLGAVVGILLIVLKIKKREEYIPYGPFLSLGAILYIFMEKFLGRIFLY